MDLTEALRHAEQLDAQDPLALVRDRFMLPEGLVYLDGNSLGALGASVPAAVRDVVREQWGQSLVGSWNSHDWWDAPRRIGGRIAGLVGAAEHEVVVSDSTSVNVFKTLVAAARLRSGRATMVVEAGNFPADLYIADAVADLLGMTVRRVDPLGIGSSLDDDVAVVSLSHVDYRTGRAYDMRGITKAAHDAGAVVVWDLSHSAGAMVVALDDCGVDFAVGCGYKYLNGGPGAPAYVMAAERHHATMRSPLPGWTGHARPFAMEGTYEPAPGIDSMRCGTPPMLSLLALESALVAFDGVTMAQVRARSLSLTTLFLDMADEHLVSRGFGVVTPRLDEERGSQVSLHHADAYGVVQALAARGVVGDFRHPDIVRLGFSPLYVRHVDVVVAVEHLVEAVDSEEHRDDRWAVRSTVT